MLGLGVSSLFAAAITGESGPSSGKPDLVDALTNHDVTTQAVPANLDALARGVAEAKRRYQACQYQALTDQLPALLEQLRAACLRLDGDRRLRACRLVASGRRGGGAWQHSAHPPRSLRLLKAR